MKKLVLLCLVGLAVFGVWKYAGQGGGSDPLADLEHRLQAAESAYRSAGRAAGVSGIDTSSDAEAALAEVGRVEQELKEMSRTASSKEVKDRIRHVVEEASMVRRRIGG